MLSSADTYQPWLQLSRKSVIVNKSLLGEDDSFGEYVRENLEWFDATPTRIELISVRGEIITGITWEKAESGFLVSSIIPEINVYGLGDTLEEAKQDFRVALSEFHDLLKSRRHCLGKPLQEQLELLNSFCD